MHILVTGGAGYIGSHTCVELLQAGYTVTVVDNLCNSSEKALERVKQITGKDLRFVQADIADAAAMDAVFSASPVDAVIHFAGLKAVGESVEKPLEYYRNNISGSLVLCDVMRRHGVKNIFSAPPRPSTGTPSASPSRKRARRACAPIPTAGRSGCWSRS